MKYLLVEICDGEVYLGQPSEILDEDGDPIEENYINTTSVNFWINRSI